MKGGADDPEYFTKLKMFRCQTKSSVFDEHVDDALSHVV